MIPEHEPRMSRGETPILADELNIDQLMSRVCQELEVSPNYARYMCRDMICTIMELTPSQSYEDAKRVAESIMKEVFNVEGNQHDR